MSNENLYSLFESRFPADRATPLLLLDSGRTLTYADADAGSARYASLLASRGLKPGDRVAVQVEKSPEALLLYLGCLRAGVAYLPLNSAYQEAEVSYFLENAEPGAVVGQPKSMPWLAPLAERRGIRNVFTLDDHGHGSLIEAARGAPETFATVPRSGDDLAAIRQLPEVGAAAPQLRGNAQIVSEQSNWQTQINATTPEWFAVRAWKVAAGDILSDADVNGARKVAVIGKTVAVNLFGTDDPSAPVGQTIRIDCEYVVGADDRGQFLEQRHGNSGGCSGINRG